MGKWKTTKYQGVRYREHPSRKHGIKFDRYFTIRYQKDGGRREEGLGWASEEWSEERAALTLAELKKAAQTGEGPQRLKEKREIAAKKRAKEEARKIEEERRELTFGKYFELTYMPEAKANKVKGSWQAEEGFYQNWIKDVIGDKPLCEIAPIHLERLKKNMSEAGKSTRTIDYALATIRQVFNHAVQNNLFDGKNPVKHVKVKRNDNKRQRYLTFKESQQILSELKKKSLLWHDISLLSLHCGLRASEIFRLTWQDVDFDKKQLFIRDPKSGKNRFAFLTEQTFVMLKQRFEIRTDESYIFKKRTGGKLTEVSDTFARTVSELGLNEGISDCRMRVVFHSLRHTYASWLVENGTDIYTVSKLLGHSTISMTQRYAHLGENSLRAAVARLEWVNKAEPRDYNSSKTAEGID